MGNHLQLSLELSPQARQMITIRVSTRNKINYQSGQSEGNIIHQPGNMKTLNQQQSHDIPLLRYFPQQVKSREIRLTRIRANAPNFNMGSSLQRENARKSQTNPDKKLMMSHQRSDIKRQTYPSLVAVSIVILSI